MTDRDPAGPRRTPKKPAPVDPAAGAPAPRRSRAAAAPGGTPPSADAPSADAPSADAPSADAPSADAPSADAPSAEAPPASTALRDRWWWSPTLMIVVGLVVIGYQLEPLRSSNAVWGNWAVAALGLVVVVHGAVQLHRAHRARGSR
jgi:hypothetical protein